MRAKLFLDELLPDLESRWQIRLSRRLRDWRAGRIRVDPVFEILPDSANGFAAEMRFPLAEGELLSEAEVHRCLRGGRVQKGAQEVVLSERFKRVLQPLLEDADLSREGRALRGFGASAELLRELCKYSSKTNNKSKLNKTKSWDLPATLVAKLRTYQQQGYDWMNDRLERFQGALLADDMGLGKTVQTIAVVERMLEDAAANPGIVLVVVPRSLIGNWQQEWERFAPARQVQILHGADRDSRREEIRPGNVVLTTYGTLARDLAWHLRRHYRMVVLDEASALRNPNTDHAKAIFKLQADARLALTGTPLENGVRDLWSIMRFIQPGWLGTRREFEERYPAAVAGDVLSGEMERLRLKVSPFLLRRTKEAVAPELPSKTVSDVICELTEHQQRVYRDLLQESRRRIESLDGGAQSGAARMQVLTALLRLRQCCGDLGMLGVESLERLPVEKRSSKMVHLLELLDEAMRSGRRVLVFSQFQRQLVAIEKALKERKVDCLRLDGGTSNRQQLVDRFQSAEGPPVFLISLKAGGYGLNLTAADMVVHFDPWWNPAAEAQATDRAHRIGQTRPVHVYRLLTRNTVEEQVVRLQERKRALAALVDEEGGGDATGWSMEQLRSLLNGA
ncbi:MAG: DEAD/DEAH box helicase [Akkermansiaceae bacterium]|nr:DEAD/DEAH box helicase [Akkermansiaceae bacterium]